MLKSPGNLKPKTQCQADRTPMDEIFTKRMNDKTAQQGDWTLRVQLSQCSVALACICAPFALLGLVLCQDLSNHNRSIASIASIAGSHSICLSVFP